MNSSIFFHKGFRRLALASAVVLGTVGASYSFAAEDTATSDATVVTPISIAMATNLNFGEFAADPTTAGTVDVSTAGAATATTAVVTNDAAASAASFTVGGSANAGFSVGVTDNDLAHTDGVNTMMLTTKHDADATTEDSLASYTLDGTGAATIYVGGTVDVPAGQLAGAYSGTVTVAVAYE